MKGRKRMKFEAQELQEEINRIQKEDVTPNFMLVEVYSGYYIDKYGMFRDELDEVAFFPPVSKNRNELLKELAKAIIEQSL